MYKHESMHGSHTGSPEQRLVSRNDNFIVRDDVRGGHEDAEGEERVVAIPLQAGGGHCSGALQRNEAARWTFVLHVLGESGRARER